MKHIFKTLLILSMAVLLAGCGATRKSGNVTEAYKSTKQQYEAMLKSDFGFQCLQSKVKYSLGDKSQNGKLYVEHGKRLCMTMSVLGIEVARFEANRETVLFVTKFNKQYTSMPVAEMAQKLGLQDEASFDVLEALILGRVYVPGKGLAATGDYKRFAWTTTEEKVAQAIFEGDVYNLCYTIGPDNLLSSTCVSVPAGNMTSTISYLTHQAVEKGGSLPATEQLDIQGNGLALKLGLNIDAPSLGSKGWTSFVPTDRYEKVSFRELVEAIMKMK